MDAQPMRDRPAVLRLLAVVPLALAALLPGTARAQAPAPALDVALAAGWDGVHDLGWVPYAVSIQNRGGADFTGTVRLVPEWRTAGVSLPWRPPVYTSPVTVPAGGARRVVFAVRGERYYAEVLDRAGQAVRRARLTPTAPNLPVAAAFTVGLLTASDESEAEVRSLSDLVRLGVFRMASPADLSANPALLGNLAVVVLTRFDASALAPAQVAALERYVAAGGTLALTGGRDWPRTLGGLPPALTPLRPAGGADASLETLAELAGRGTAASAPVATGRVAAGVVMLDASDGTPLVVDAPLGSGHVVELTFDPADLAADRPLAQLGWAQAILRARGGLGLFGHDGGQRMPSGFGYAGPVDATWMLPLLQRLGAAPPRPTPGLVGALLLGPALLLGLVAAALALRRRPPSRFWAAPLALALAVPAGLGTGGAALGSAALVDGEVQVLLPLGDGRVLAQGSHALLAAAPGDYRLPLAPGTLVGRLDYSIRPLGPLQLPDALWQAVPAQALTVGGLRSPGAAVVVSGVDAPELDLLGAGTGPVLTVETASVRAAGVDLEGRLDLAGGRVRGTVANRGTREIRGLRLYGGSADAGSAERAVFGLDLPPGRSAAVDAPLTTYRPAVVQPMTDEAPGAARSAGDEVAELAAARVVRRPGDLALVGLTDPLPEVQPGGSPVRVRGLAAVVSPVRLTAADRFLDRWSFARPVSLARSESGRTDVYELDAPPGAHPGLSLRYTGRAVGLSPASMELYDWASRAWRPVPVAAGAASVPLSASELGPGVVRVRVREATPLGGDWDLRIGDAAG
jgi:hypothetical protein